MVLGTQTSEALPSQTPVKQLSGAGRGGAKQSKATPLQVGVGVKAGP